MDIRIEKEEGVFRVFINNEFVPFSKWGYKKGSFSPWKKWYAYNNGDEIVIRKDEFGKIKVFIFKMKYGKIIKKTFRSINVVAPITFSI